MPDIRWKQRLQNYKSALAELEEAVAESRKRPLSKLEKQGLIQAFEFTHELAWNVLKDYFKDQGNSGLTGSKDATREAFKVGLILDGDGWMEMIRSRNQASLSYDKATADEIADQIVSIYFNLFVSLKDKMESVVKDNCGLSDFTLGS